MLKVLHIKNNVLKQQELLSILCLTCERKQIKEVGVKLRHSTITQSQNYVSLRTNGFMGALCGLRAVLFIVVERRKCFTPLSRNRVFIIIVLLTAIVKIPYPFIH